MARQQEISDEDLAKLRKQFTPAQIARKTGLNPSSISRRLKRIEEQGVRPAAAPPVVKPGPAPKQSFEEKIKALEAAGIAVEDGDETAGEDAGDVDEGAPDIEAIAIKNLRRAEAFAKSVFDPLDKQRAIASISRCADHVLRVRERLVGIEEIRAFFHEVLAELDECEPGTRARIIDRLEKRRALRCAPGTTA